MALYEQVFIARQDISAAQVDGLIEQFKKIAEDNGGKVTKEEYWGLKTMAYRIKKNRKGHYILFNLDAPAAAVHEMERNMRLSEDVLRYLTLRVEELEEGPSVMMQHRRERRDRRDDDERGRDSRAPSPPAAEQPAAAAEQPAAAAEQPAAAAEQPAAAAEKTAPPAEKTAPAEPVSAQPDEA